VGHDYNTFCIHGSSLIGTKRDVQHPNKPEESVKWQVQNLKEFAQAPLGAGYW
jgi:hypothetical protein